LNRLEDPLGSGDRIRMEGWRTEVDLGLDGKTALVTGASAGLGFGVAHALSAEGVRLVVNARDEGRLASAVERLNRSCTGEAIAVSGDVSVTGEPERIAREAEHRVGPLSILVVNAGGPPPGRFLDLTEEDWATGFQRTLMSAVRLTRAVLPGMVERDYGRIVFITSSSVKQPIDGLVLSNAFRPGIAGLAKTLTNELGDSRVTVNCVCPGPYATERMTELIDAQAQRAGTDRKEALRRALSNVPAGRFGEPIELGRVVAFLASDHAAFVRGVAWSVDGGSVRGIFG
jgi:3-oxoacyl-[acyl-carrier protein] reductase